MRRLGVGIAIAVWLVGSSAVAGQRASNPAPDQVSVQDALDEPADPDDADDIRADHDPDDAGQRGLDPAKSAKPEGAHESGGSCGAADADSGTR